MRTDRVEPRVYIVPQCGVDAARVLLSGPICIYLSRYSVPMCRAHTQCTQERESMRIDHALTIYSRASASRPMIFFLLPVGSTGANLLIPGSRCWCFARINAEGYTCRNFIGMVLTRGCIRIYLSSRTLLFRETALENLELLLRWLLDCSAGLSANVFWHC